MKYALNWKQPLLYMSKRFFIFITLIFSGCTDLVITRHLFEASVR